MKPKEIITKWVVAFNAADIDTLIALYHDEAVNHQVINAPVEGKAAIKEMFIKEFATAKMVAEDIGIR